MLLLTCILLVAWCLHLFLYQFENYWDLLCNYDLWASYLCSRSRSHFGLPYIFPPIQVLTTWTTCGGLRSNFRSRFLELQALRLVLAQVLLRMTMMTFLSLSLERHLRRLLKRKRSRHNFAACLLLWRVYKSSIAIRKDILLRPLTYLICACGPVLSCTRIWSDVLVGFHMKYASFWYPYSRCFVCFVLSLLCVLLSRTRFYNSGLTIVPVFWRVVWSLADGHRTAMVSWLMEMRRYIISSPVIYVPRLLKTSLGFMLPSLILIWFFVKNLLRVAATSVLHVFIRILWRWSSA